MSLLDWQNNERNEAYLADGRCPRCKNPLDVIGNYENLPEGSLDRYIPNICSNCNIDWSHYLKNIE